MSRRMIVVGLVLAMLALACGGGSGEVQPLSGPGPTDEPDQPDEPDDPPVDVGELLEIAIVDVQDYWSFVYPDLFGADFVFVDDLSFIAASSRTEFPECFGEDVTFAEVEDNAFFIGCPEGELLAWDSDFLADLSTDVGDFVPAMVIAHELSHAVQFRAGFLDPALGLPTIITELQADCLTGAWMADVAEGGSDILELHPNALLQGLAGMLEVRDQVGLDPLEVGAHGSGFDRVSAFQDGFEIGPGRCVEYPDTPPFIVETPFTSEEDFDLGGNLPLPEALELAAFSLNGFWTAVYSDFEPVDDIDPYSLDDPDMPTCGDLDEPDELTGLIFYCPDGNYVAFHDVLIQDVYDLSGDFGVATILSFQWGMSRQIQTGILDDTLGTTLHAHCHTGAWAADAFLGQLSFERDGEVQTMVLSPGDLDETVVAFLAFAATPDDFGQTDLGNAFEWVSAFRAGFIEGVVACDAFLG